MITYIYAIKDLNADYFMQPMFMRTSSPFSLMVQP